MSVIEGIRFTAFPLIINVGLEDNINSIAFEDFNIYVVLNLPCLRLD